MKEIGGRSRISNGAIIGIALIIIIVINAGVYFYMDGKIAKERESSNSQIAELQKQVSDLKVVSVQNNKTSAINTSNPSNDEMASWKTYTNTKYDYSLKYPESFTMTASADNLDDLPIGPTADSVNVFPVNGSVPDGIFFVDPGVEFTIDAIKDQFSATNKDNIIVTPMTIGGASAYKVKILGDSGVVSTFYDIKSPSGKILQLTVVNDSTDAQKILSSFQFIK